MKLTDEQIAAIKIDRRPLKIVAHDYSISQSYAQKIRGGKEIPQYAETMKCLKELEYQVSRIKELEYRIKILEGKV